MKRRFSAIAAVAVALGTCVAVPATEAATHATIARSGDTIMVGNYKAKVQGIVARDGNQMTTFLPVWYVMQGIKGLGLQATWDYSSKQLMVQTPTEIPVSVTPGPTGTGTTQLLLNGKLVHKVNTIVAKDPYSGQPTLYIPIWYIGQLLKQAHLDTSWAQNHWVLTPGQDYPDVLLTNDSLGSASSVTTVNKNVVLLGNDASLENVNVNGDVYINPGANGDVTLTNVKVSGTIYVESGANHSVHLTNVQSPLLTINSSSPVHIVAAGTTNISKTTVASTDQQAVSFDNQGGTIGHLYIQSGQDITLGGSTPYADITVEGGGHVTIAAGASVMNLTVDAANASVTVANSASVDQLNVQSGAHVALTVDGSVKTVDSTAGAGVSLSGAGSVTSVSGTGVTGTTTGAASGSSGGASTGGGSTGGSNSGGTGTGNTVNFVLTPATSPNGSVLTTPTNLKDTNGTVTWSPIADTTTYAVYESFGANQPTETETTSYPGIDLNQFASQGGQLTLSVQALGTDSSYTSSATSVTQSVYLNQLDTPQNINLSGNIVTWAPVTNATSYDVLITTSSNPNFYRFETVYLINSF